MSTRQPAPPGWNPAWCSGHLNNALRGDKLFFPVDPSTHARCTIGGMAGNNSCGSKSIRYGLMADNVLAIDAILADGTQHRFGHIPDNLGADMPANIADLIQRLRALGAAEADEIAARFPKQLRRVGGYNIDALTPAARATGRDNLARLLVGSEGTLAFSAALQLKLHPVKPRKVLGICQFPTFRSGDGGLAAHRRAGPRGGGTGRSHDDRPRPAASPIYRSTIDAMLIGEPDSVLIVEFHGHEDAPLLAKLDELETLMGDIGHPGVVRADRSGVPGRYRGGARGRVEHHDVDEGRRQTGPLHRGLRRRSRRPRRLHRTPERRVREARHQGHLVRPRLGRLPACPPGAEHEGPQRTSPPCAPSPRKPSPWCANTKARHSGEHGDGLVRSEFHEQMFGPRIVSAFETVKDAFDPTGLLNPNRIVRPPAMDDRTLFRYGPDYAPDQRLHAAARLVRPSRPARRHAGCGGDVQQQRHLPQLRRRRDVPQLSRDPRRGASDPRPSEYAAPGSVGPAGRRGDGLGRRGRGDGAVRLLQGMQARMPDRRRHGEDEDRGHRRAHRQARAEPAGLADRRACPGTQRSPRALRGWPTC